MIDTDSVVIGAGPVGLFQVFQLGLLGLEAHVIDVLPQAGGQCVALYPDKPIYDIPGVPMCTGRGLSAQLREQARPFLRSAPDGKKGVNLHLKQLVSSLEHLPDGRYQIETHQGLILRCRAVFVAAGAGAFVPKTLPLPKLEGSQQLHYHLDEVHEGRLPWSGQHLVVVGGGDEALSAILSLSSTEGSDAPSRLTLVHRRAQFQADSALACDVQALIDQGRIDLVVGMPTDVELLDGRLLTLLLLGPDGQTHRLALDHLLVRQGMSPKLGALTQWGLALERKQISVSPATFESSLPGVYAVGDINTYPGKKRLLLCGFHEATLAAHHAAAQLNPEAPQHLLYTTTSPLLHERLGVLNPQK
jgi:thioredoxin reductase (NADPH)